MKADLKEILNDEETEASDKLVLAYRLSEHKSQRKILYVKRSALENDPDLVLFEKNNLAHSFDASESLASIDNSNLALEASPHVYDKIKYQLMLDEVRRQVRADTISLKALPKDWFGIKSLDEPAAHIFLSFVTKELKQQGLWKDENEDLTMTEAFPLSQSHDDPRFKDLPTDEFEYGTFYEDDELTIQDFEVAETKSELNVTSFHFPKSLSPMLHNLMRSSPEDLKHQIARRLIDTGYFDENQTDGHLFAACYFLSKGVESEWHFEVLMEQGLAKVFSHYTFESYKIDKILLQKRIRFFIENFFSQNPRMKRFLKKSNDPEKQNHKNFWKRFNAVWENLTVKQKNVLTKMYMGEDKPTLKEAAQDFKISIDSVRSRLQTAIGKFETEFPELSGISPKGLPKSELTGAYALNYLWHYKRASVVHNLYRIDPITNQKIKLIWDKTPIQKKIDWKQRARIKAEIIENCPIPYFHETDYFDGIKPTILSYGRLPGNLIDEASNEEKDGPDHHD